jgi:tRNA 2-thiouridine synthesizing protein A
MPLVKLDYRGLKCPFPTLKMTTEIIKLSKGDIMEVWADCPSFEKDLKGFASRTNSTLLWVRNQGTCKVCQLRK